MGMFGNIGRAIVGPGRDGLSLLDRAAIFATAAEGDPRTALGLRQAGMQRQQEQQRQAIYQHIAGLLQPGYAEQAAPKVNLDDPGQNTAADYQYQAPLRTRDPLNANSPELPLLALQAEAGGVDLGRVLDVLKAQQPDVAVGPDGRPYNKKSMAGLPERFRNPTNINGWVADLNKPQNEGQYFPQLPNGVIPDGQGGVTNATGLTGALGAQEEAQTLGRTRGSMFTVPRAGGGSGLMTGGQYLGGPGGPGLQSGGDFGVSQSPADAEYDKGVAQAEQKRYEGFLAAGQTARSMEANLRRMSGLLAGVNTGRLTPIGKDMASVATSFGLQVDPKWSNVEAAQAVANKLVLDFAGGSLGSNISNSDRSFFENMGPQTAQTPQGRQQIIGFALAKAHRDGQVAEMARKWQAGAGRLDKPDRSGRTFYDYLGAWVEANPLVGSVPELPATLTDSNRGQIGEGSYFRAADGKVYRQTRGAGFGGRR